MSGAIVLDTETTGFSPFEDRVIELCVLDWTTGQTLFHSYFNPQCRIPPKITELTGITQQVADTSVLFHEHAPRIRDLILNAEAVIGYNIAFDRRFLDAELARMPLVLNTRVTWPILVDAKRVWDVCEPRPPRDLTNAYIRFVSPTGFAGAHGALADTGATRDVLRGQLAAFGLENTPWDQLDPERKAWWGPSDHILRVDGVLIMNFGKHSSRPVDEVDVGFWKWVRSKEFPDHITMLAIKLIDFSHQALTGDALRKAVTTWADVYAPRVL